MQGANEKKLDMRWSNPRLRGLVWQVAALMLVIGAIWFFVSTAHQNLERLHIASGFSFLNSTAGFGVIQSLIPYSEESSYGRAFLVGLTNTLAVAIPGIMLAVVLGFLVGVARLSNNWLVAKLATTYVELLRNLPLLLQLFFWYFAVLRPLPSADDALSPLPGVYLSNRGLVLPMPQTTDATLPVLLALLAGAMLAFVFFRWVVRQKENRLPRWSIASALLVGLPLLAALLFGVPFHLQFAERTAFDFAGGLRLLPEYMALLLGLSFYTAAFIAEIVRAGILSVSHGQWEAAYALGLRNNETLRLVIIPQALRVIVPPLTSQLLNLTKNSSLAVAIAYPDLVAVFAGTVLNQTGQAIEVIGITMAVYLFLSLVTSALMNWYNARLMRKGMRA